MSDLITTKEASKILNVGMIKTRQAINTLIRDNHKWGERIYVERKDVERLARVYNKHVLWNRKMSVVGELIFKNDWDFYLIDSYETVYKFRNYFTEYVGIEPHLLKIGDFVKIEPVVITGKFGMNITTYTKN